MDAYHAMRCHTSVFNALKIWCMTLKSKNVFACLEHTLQISQFNAYFATHNVERVQGHSEMIALIVRCHLHNLSTTQLRTNAK